MFPSLFPEVVFIFTFFVFYNEMLLAYMGTRSSQGCIREKHIFLSVNDNNNTDNTLRWFRKIKEIYFGDDSGT